jgi:hypothetical protein
MISSLACRALDLAQADVRAGVRADVEAGARQLAYLIPRHPARLAWQISIPPRHGFGTHELGDDEERRRQTERLKNRAATS